MIVPSGCKKVAPPPLSLRSKIRVRPALAASTRIYSLSISKHLACPDSQGGKAGFVMKYACGTFFFAGVLVGVCVTLALHRPALAPNEVRPPELAQTDARDEVKIRSITVSDAIRKSIQPRVERDIREINALNKVDGKWGALVGKDLVTISPCFKSVTGIQMTTWRVTLEWDASTDTVDIMCFVTFRMRDLVITDVL
jgi:hypothetical protein